MQDTLNQAAEIERLRKENEYYRNLLTFSSAGILVTSNSEDGNGIQVLEINGAFTTMTGYTMDDIHTIHDDIYLNLVDKRDRNCMWELILTQLFASNRYKTTYRLNTKIGGFVWVKETGQLCGKNPTVRESILIDITALIWHQVVQCSILILPRVLICILRMQNAFMAFPLLRLFQIPNGLAPYHRKNR